MKKRLSILVLLAFILALTACGRKDISETADNVFKQLVENVVKKDDGASQNSIEIYDLTEEQQKLVGIWESPEGCILAVRASRVPDWETGFPLDIIYLYPYISTEAEEVDDLGWLKFTTEYEGCSIEVTDENIIVLNETFCPQHADPTQDVSCEYRLELDLATDELLLHYHKDEWIDGNQIMHEFNMTRTDRDIEEANWDWYYGIHPERDVRK